jgi:raffinose/stachyose/melibiose transport system permease protein
MRHKEENMNKEHNGLSKFIFMFVFLLLITYSVIIIYPLLWMIISGFKTNQELFLEPWGLPAKLLWSNYKSAWDVGVGKFFVNSLFVTSVSVTVTLFISACCAFPLSRYEFKGQNIFLLIIIGGMMLAPQVSLISLYKLLQRLKIYNTYWALIIPYIAFRIPFTTFLIRSYMLSLPREIEDSAYIDGCTSWRLFWNIILPMCKPIMATSALLAAMSVWNEFMFALVFIEDSTLRTIPVGIMNLRSTLSTNWTILLAALTISALPMIILFIVFQKQFVRGITQGGVKG